MTNLVQQPRFWREKFASLAHWADPSQELSGEKIKWPGLYAAFQPREVQLNLLYSTEMRPIIRVLFVKKLLIKFSKFVKIDSVPGQLWLLQNREVKMCWKLRETTINTAVEMNLNQN